MTTSVERALDAPLRVGLMPPLPTRTYGGAEARTIRLVSAVVGVATIVFGALATPSLAVMIEGGGQTFLSPDAHVAVFAVTLGPAALLGVLAPFVPVRVLPVIAGAVALVYLASMSLLVIGALTPEAVAVQDPWPLSVTALPCVCAAIAWRSWGAWTYLITVSALSYVLSAYGEVHSVDPFVEGFERALYGCVFVAIFVGLARIAVANARRLDAAEARASADATRLAARSARQAERARFDALIHDGVFSILLMAGHDELSSTDGAVLARRTLDQLDAARGTGRRTSVPTLIGALQELVDLHGRAPHTSIAFEVIDNGDPGAIPPDVFEAIIGAVGEALRNTARHAGTGPEGRMPTQQLRVAADHGILTVVVRDDGAGFDPSGVPESRLGIERSIHSRMRSVAGGRSEIVSRPGDGTSVVLNWRAP